MKNPTIWLSLLTVLLAAAMIASLAVGPAAISLRDVLSMLLQPNRSADDIDSTIILNLRLRRVLLATFIGMGLGSSGASLQGLFRNPLADPFLIGASTGAALGATLAIIFAGSSLWGIGLLPLAALVGAILAVLLVYQLASVGGQTPTVSLILAGTALSSFLGAIVTLLAFWSQNRIFMIYGWLLGSTDREWEVIAIVVPLILFGVALTWTQSRGLDALVFGEESAMALGMNLKKFRRTVIVAAGITTAASVAGGGVLGFIGLIAPHIARRVVGARHATLIPASALAGALLLLVADDIARVAAAPQELPLGVVTALFGAPFFLYVLRSRPTSGGNW